MKKRRVNDRKPLWMGRLVKAAGFEDRGLATKIRLAALSARIDGARPRFTVGAERAASAVELLGAAGFIEIEQDASSDELRGLQLIKISFTIGRRALEVW